MKLHGLLMCFAAFAAGCSGQPSSAIARHATPSQPMTLAQLGQRAFMRCQACHSIGSGGAHKVGPNLHGLTARKAGTAAGYQYSPELVTADLNWDAGTLGAWISDPAMLVPGTTMVYANDLTGEEIVALVAYLQARTSSINAGH